MSMKRVPPWGALESEIAFIGQSPGKQEQIRNRPFVGPAGKVLRAICAEVGINLDKCYLTNVCDKVLLGSAQPTEEDIAEGHIRLEKEISKLKNLETIVLVGIPASRLVFSGAMQDMCGQEGELFGHPVTAIFHPSAILRSKDSAWGQNMRDRNKEVLSKLVNNAPKIITPTRQSGVAVLLGGRPEAVKASKAEAPAKGGAVAPDWLRILIDETLEKQQPLWEEPRAYFRGSEVGDSCLRSLCLSAMGHRMPIEARLRRIFNTGNSIEASNIATFVAADIIHDTAQAEVIYEDPPIAGHVDAILRRPHDGEHILCEIKSINENSFKRLPKEHDLILAGQSPLLKTHYRYILQWNTYVGAPNLGLREGFILFESKDKQNQKFYWLLRDEELLEKTLARLRLAAPYILSDPMRVPPVSLEPDKDSTHKNCMRRYLCMRIPDEGATLEEVRKIDKQVRG